MPTRRAPGASLPPRPERARQERVREWLAAEGCEAAVIVDLEGLRDRSLRYLSGHVGDALLFLFSAVRETLLIPWDLPLAQRLSCVDRLTAFERYERSVLLAVTEVLTEHRVRRVELSGKLPFPLVDRLKAALPQTEIPPAPQSTRGEAAVAQEDAPAPGTGEPFGSSSGSGAGRRWSTFCSRYRKPQRAYVARRLAETGKRAASGSSRSNWSRQAFSRSILCVVTSAPSDNGSSLMNATARR